MARTDKDAPWHVREARGEIPTRHRWGTETGFRKARKALKRQGNKRMRRDWNLSVKSWDRATIRSAVYYY